ncbi:transposase [Cohnella massiliensis]|uniref:transposase n=1 Tax=Cohnella massiliensis TaxID=1816691 RepID=UPI00111AF4AD|nr:transposase [Cohnella massiliensis]
MIELMSFEEFCELVRDESHCIRILFQAKWPHGFRCPRCAHPHASVTSTRRLPLYDCRACGKQTSLTVGTIMEGSRTPLRLWFQALFLHAQPDDINAVQLSERIGVTYKTSWLMCHKIRHAMRQAEDGQLLTGTVCMINAIYSEKFRASAEGHKQEQPVIVGASVGLCEEMSRIKIKKQPKTPRSRAPEISDRDRFEEEWVDEEADVDLRWRLMRYRSGKLKRIFKTAENWLADLFRGIGSKHLQAYLEHFCYLWNRQAGMIFIELLIDCATRSTITYPALTGTPGKSKHVRSLAAIPPAYFPSAS